MPPKKRKATKKAFAGPPAKRSTATMVNKMKKMVVQAIARNIETKQSSFSTTDMQELLHNTIRVLDDGILRTTQGVSDPMNTDSLNRIGDEVNLKGVSVKMMLELHPNYSDVTYRIMVIKCAKGDTVNTTTLWKGQSRNKMIDTFNTERFQIIFQKYVKITARNPGVSSSADLTAGNEFRDFVGATGITNVDGTNQTTNLMGLYPQAGTNGVAVLSSSTKIVKFYIPGKRFVKNGHLKYENGTDQPKFFDYKMLIYAYANGRTGVAGGVYTAEPANPNFIVGYVNDKITTMYYKDA